MEVGSVTLIVFEGLKQSNYLGSDMQEHRYVKYPEYAWIILNSFFFSSFDFTHTEKMKDKKEITDLCEKWLGLSAKMCVMWLILWSPVWR